MFQIITTHYGSRYIYLYETEIQGPSQHTMFLKQHLSLRNAKKISMTKIMKKQTGELKYEVS
jgi:hypothetical protein